MVNVSAALNRYNTNGIDWRADFHTLTTSQVEVIVELARESGYRKPKDANGSTGRYYFEAVARMRRREGR